ncbi:MAG: carbon starvation protein A, partial [Verrucomicrobia bacterium]|nr:carbon starvation protein A [Verrucomicrobiota bacterium]
AIALITLLPLVWLLSVTFTAGAQKIGHSKPGIGFLAANRVLQPQVPKLQAALTAARAGGDEAAIAKASKDLHLNRVKRFNNTVDTAVTGLFMVLVAAIVVLSVREWLLLLGRRKPAVLCETEAVWLPDYAVSESAVWLPDYAVSESRPLGAAGVAALVVALTKELSGEAELERAGQAASLCECRHDGASGLAEQHGIQPRKISVQVYLEVAEKRFKGIKRCC